MKNQKGSISFRLISATSRNRITRIQSTPLPSKKVEALTEPVEDKDGIPCTREDIERVVGIMKRHRRTIGYIAFMGNTLEFFDSEPSDGGALVTLQMMQNSLKNFDQT